MTRRISMMTALATLALAAGCDGMNGGGDGSGASRFDLFQPKAPAEGQFTILLFAEDGPDHVERIRYLHKATREHTGWSDLMVVHEENRSVLYWGSHATRQDAEPALKKAKEYRSSQGLAPFATAIIVPLGGQENVGPPEWNLARAAGPYTLVVAKFYDMPDKNYVGRKKFAVDYCRRLREGGYEAYYFHGPAVSAVTIGSFPKSSLQETSADGTPRMIVRDPKHPRLMEEFPQLAVNGQAIAQQQVNPRTGQAEMVVQPTYVTTIPGKDKDAQPTDPRGDTEPRQIPRNLGGPF